MFVLCMVEEEAIPIPADTPALIRRTAPTVLAAPPVETGVPSSSRAIPARLNKRAPLPPPVTMECLEEDTAGVEPVLSSEDNGEDDEDADEEMPELRSSSGTTVPSDSGTYLSHKSQHFGHF